MKKLLMALCLLSMTQAVKAERVTYEFDINHVTVNKTGKPVKAMAIGGSIPAPLIEAQLGDSLEVTFHNKMNVETSVHWHGILLPPEQDGVPWLNTKPIPPGQSHTFKFDILHTGTYWYHSHTGLQEERGIYGPIRLLNTAEKKDPNDLMLVWSDWTTEDPMDIHRNLKRDGDYYALQKDSVQSWDKVISHGWPAIKNRINSSWTRMGPMDLSDVGYDGFLANGEEIHQLANAKAGETYRIRMINAAASSYFNIEFSGGPMTIIAVDGIDIEPLVVKRLKHAIAETYDVLITIPSDGNFEIRATNTDGTGYASAYLGKGTKIKAPDIPRPNLFWVDHSAHMKPKADRKEEAEVEECAPMHAAMGHCTPTTKSDADPIDHLTTYDPIKSPVKTTYDQSAPVRKVTLKLTGNMERYIWSFNGKTMSEADRILIKKGERVQFEFENTTMMNHPLHLHGHFFRVLNGQGDYSPLKHTVDLASMSSLTIEFAANEEADWIFHCHNLYHMKSGMSRVVSYQDSSKVSDAFVRTLVPDDHWFKFADLALLSNQHMGRLWMVNNRYQLEAEWEGDYHGDYEAELRGEYFLSKFSEFIAGVEHSKKDQESTHTTGYVGAAVVLPLLIDAEMRLDSKGHVQLGVSSDLQLADRLKFKWQWNTDNEYRLTLDYALSKKVSLIATQHDDFGVGVGVKAKF